MKKVLVIILVCSVGVAAASDDVFGSLAQQAEQTIRRGSRAALAGSLLLVGGIAYAGASDAGPIVKVTIGTAAIGGGIVGLVAGPVLHKTGTRDLLRFSFASRIEEALSPREIDAIVAGEAFRGMSEMALLASWGSPVRVTADLTRDTIAKHYLYGRSQAAEILNGKVISFRR